MSFRSPYGSDGLLGAIWPVTAAVRPNHEVGDPSLSRYPMHMFHHNTTINIHRSEVCDRLPDDKTRNRISYGGRQFYW